ncbi:hypothetical protein [Staphylococcus simulans]|uniref:hypothetical protein n=1 Tax=Staphylococcus simulans TaxID=1286 RepID=UPI0028A40891|nr:hypothetical protein [Staphylococcus simulans]MDT4011630.1 hypothetical protein [Staphylococcus simulans]
MKPRDYEQLVKEIKVLEVKAQAFEEVACMYINQEQLNIPDAVILRVLKEQIEKYRNFMEDTDND